MAALTTFIIIIIINIEETTTYNPPTPAQAAENPVCNLAGLSRQPLPYQRLRCCGQVKILCPLKRLFEQLVRKRPKTGKTY
jgi:hypothetical protein